jgi:uncharacterized protein
MVLVLFAVLHDARRIGDDHDPQHGERAAALARSLDLGRFGVREDQLAVLEIACRDHTTGGVSNDPTIGTCWDADRLLLWRVGITPEARYMSTKPGRLAAASGRAPQEWAGENLVGRRQPAVG